MDLLNPFVRLVANRFSFRFFQRLGLHIVRANFGSPIPNTRGLDSELWSRMGSLSGVEMNEDDQLEMLSTFSKAYRPEYEALETPSFGVNGFFIKNIYFSSVDAEILYCFVRHYKPARVIEIGSGFSTLVSARALLQNHADGTQMGTFTAIEPYPREFLRRGVPGLKSLVEKEVQSVPVDFFDQLGANDILFIDSSHIVKTGSDVNYEFLEILPRLRKGVLVHVHDIFLPSDYPREQVVDKALFFNEQYLLQAFLQFNPAFRILWCGSLMHLKHPDRLAGAFSSYDRKANWPGSFWMQKIS